MVTNTTSGTQKVYTEKNATPSKEDNDHTTNKNNIFLQLKTVYVFNPTITQKKGEIKQLHI